MGTGESLMSKRCDHSGGNIQQFTEMCLDCFHNIYETDEEYINSLETDIRLLKADLQRKSNAKKIEALEQEYDELQVLIKEADNA